MPSSLTSPAPYHLLAYGTLLGSSLFHSFIGSTLQFTHLPRPYFGQLQEKTFPWYFGIQSTLPILMTLTYPGAINSGLAAVSAPENRSRVAIPIAVMWVTGLLNSLWIGPWTTKLMHQRRDQEKRDGKRRDDEVKSEEMQRLNKTFGALHGASTLINLTGIVAMVVYGFTLGKRL